jgi:hypothetical protein
VIINGPVIEKTITIPERVVQVLDEDAYWHLDWSGTEDSGDGTFLYAKVAYPRLKDAQEQHAMLKTVREAWREHARKATRRRKKVTA